MTLIMKLSGKEKLVKCSIEFDDERQEDLKIFLTKILSLCVESEQTGALESILKWIEQDIASNDTLAKLVERWHVRDKKNSNNDGFTFNNNALIR